MFDKLQSNNIAILGLGSHGGGLSSARFASYKRAKHIAIFDNAPPEKLQNMLHPLSSIVNTLSVEPYTRDALAKYDLVIKSPAVPRNAAILEGIVHIETDISLYYQYQSPSTWMVTGSKGKSSVSTALYNLLLLQSNSQSSNQANSKASQKNIKQCNAQSSIKASLAGNITVSPLQLIIEDTIPEHLVLELSSFQLGDLSLVADRPFYAMDAMILTNLFQDHLNYYPSLEAYAADKFYPFYNIPDNGLALLPYTSETVIVHKDSITLNLYNNSLRLPLAQCYFHSNEILPPTLQGSWTSADGIHSRVKSLAKETLVVPNTSMPTHIPPINLAIVVNLSLGKNIAVLPKNAEEWSRLFSIVHRKELVRIFKKRKFYNDSAATIPQAMQLELFLPRRILLIAGGTDKNLNPQDFLQASAPATQLYLLDGSYTEQILHLLHKTNRKYSGPYNKLSQAVESAVKDSKEEDIILLSPGCASFGMFLHEFDRGAQFRNLVQQL